MEGALMIKNWKRKKFIDFTIEEYQDRLKYFWNYLQKEGMDGAVITQKESLEYFTGFRTDLMASKYWTQGMGCVIALDREPIVFTTTIDIGAAETLCWMDDKNIREWSPTGMERGFKFNTGEGLIISIINELGLENKTIGFEIGLAVRMTMPYDQFQRILKKLPNAKVKDVGNAVMMTREIKSDAEIDRIKMACHITSKGIDAVWKMLDNEWRSGITQIDLQQECARMMAANGGELLSFNCWSGPPYMDMSNGATLPIKVKRGDIVNLDICGKYRSYVSDFMRIAFIGGKPKKEWADMLSTLREAQMASIELLKPGTRGEELEKLCNSIIKKAGYWEDYIFAGHGIGLEAHELPRLQNALFRKGMITTVEPAIFPARRLKGAPDAPGFWIEDVIVITEDGFEILSNYDQEPYIVL